jgi:hypothetical protein
MTTTRGDLDTADEVLAFARDSRARADRAEADLLLAAVTWAEHHPPESIAVAATRPGTEGALILAGDGAPVWRSSASPSSPPPSAAPPTPGAP